MRRKLSRFLKNLWCVVVGHDWHGETYRTWKCLRCGRKVDLIRACDRDGLTHTCYR